MDKILVVIVNIFHLTAIALKRLGVANFAVYLLHVWLDSHG